MPFAFVTLPKNKRGRSALALGSLSLSLSPHEPSAPLSTIQLPVLKRSQVQRSFGIASSPHVFVPGVWMIGESVWVIRLSESQT